MGAFRCEDPGAQGQLLILVNMMKEVKSCRETLLGRKCNQ